MPPRTRKAAAAKPPGVALPKDRLGKMPRVTRVTVPLDDEAVQALLDAREAHDAAASRLAAERGRRINQARQADLAAEQNDLEKAVDREIDAELDPLAKAVTVAEDAVRASSRTFTFRALGRRAYQDLLDQHPARDEDHEDVQAQGLGQKAAYHALTFAPAVVQASAVDPALSDADIADIFETGNWNHNEVAQLFMAALEVNTQRRLVELPR